MTSCACRWLMAAVGAWALAGCATSSAEDDPIQGKLTDLDSRLARVERAVSNPGLLEVGNQIEALRSDLRAMHNDVDVLNHSLEANRKQQHDLYADVDQRLKALEARGAVAGGAAASGAGAAAASGTGAGSADAADKMSYQAAFDLLKNTQIDRAIQAFQNFLAAYPNSPLADNAQYWLGEAYYVNKSYPEARNAFERVMEKYPASRKLADAQVKIGYCDYELQQFAAARDELAQVVAKYPDSPAAKLAQGRLDKLSAEGH